MDPERIELSSPSLQGKVAALEHGSPNGTGEIRTHSLCSAKAALCQLELRPQIELCGVRRRRLGYPRFRAACLL